MTPKEAYEARKAERKSRANKGGSWLTDQKDLEMFDLFDRFVTAAERIADALESKP